MAGILVQLPLPKHINEEKILSQISLEKDVDGFHPLNIGKLAMKGRDPLFLPCTPKAIYHKSTLIPNQRYISSIVAYNSYRSLLNFHFVQVIIVT